jgi:pectate lyase
MKYTIRLFLGVLGMSFVGPQAWAANACVAQYTISSQDKDSFKVNVTIVNQGKALSSWKVDWKMPNGQQITSLNNGTYFQKKEIVTVENLPSHGNVPLGASIAFNFAANYSVTNSLPNIIAVNGHKCAALNNGASTSVPVSTLKPTSNPTPPPQFAPNPTPKPTPQPTADASFEVAPNNGWAGEAGGTSGGSAALTGEIYKASSPSALLTALKSEGKNVKIVKVYGTIDMAAADNGGAFTNKSDQALRGEIDLPSNTTLIGMDSDAKIVNANIKITNVDNVIVRNLTIVNPCDISPTWDPNDGSTGNWNSEYDGITVSGGTHIWIDHNKFTDAPKTDDQFPVVNGKLKQCHDGALDIKNGADFVTVPYNTFEQHAKNNLVGASDSRKDIDDGHLAITFHHNLFSNVAERAPRVRFGKVHLYNNYHQGSRTAKPYATQYSVGVGYLAKIISENNVFDINGAKACGDVIKNPGSSSKTGAITDVGSLLNGASLALSSKCSFSVAVGWAEPYQNQDDFVLTETNAVNQTVLDNAGLGKLIVK